MNESNIVNTLITGLCCFLFIVPCIIIIFGISTLIIKPKQNKLFGYRTKLHFLQVNCGNTLIKNLLFTQL